MVNIIRYEPRYQADFKRINVAWIQEAFVVEPHDLEQLDHPEIYILPNGGEILLAEYQGEIIGTVAIVRTGAHEFELAKMGVSSSARGLGAGKILCHAAIEYARNAGAALLWLESNRKAVTAIHIYRAEGFVEKPMLPTPYARADIRMELAF